MSTKKSETFARNSINFLFLRKNQFRPKNFPSTNSNPAQRIQFSQTCKKTCVKSSNILAQCPILIVGFLFLGKKPVSSNFSQERRMRLGHPRFYCRRRSESFLLQIRFKRETYFNKSEFATTNTHPAQRLRFWQICGRLCVKILKSYAPSSI